MPHGRQQFTIGSMFAGIGGFDLGFERAGWATRWQIEINPALRALLAARFPRARRFEDVRFCRGDELAKVDCITAGFPCQDLSQSGSRRAGGIRGLEGERSGLFWEVIRLLREVRPQWVVLENVTGMLHARTGRDFETVVNALGDSGYVGFWRVLDAEYFGVPQKRRRVFLVAGRQQLPPLELLADALPVEGLPIAIAPALVRAADSWAGHTLLAVPSACAIALGSAVLVAEADRWRAMAQRARNARLHGIRLGLDGPNLLVRHAAGNAVVPACAEWIARHLTRAMVRCN